jgi:cation diffusion facilitator CzcD-associated flavoprotein CzcO
MAAPVIATDNSAAIALVGGGPASLVAAIALARRGVRTAVFERDAHPQVAPRFNPDRSYTIEPREVATRHAVASSPTRSVGADPRCPEAKWPYTALVCRRCAVRPRASRCS